MKFRDVLLLCSVAILMVGCGTGSSAGWEDLREEANTLYNDQQYQEALDVYEQAMSMASGKDRLTLRQDIIDCYQSLGNQTKARELLKVQLDEAHAIGDLQMEAEAPTLPRRLGA